MTGQVRLLSPDEHYQRTELGPLTAIDFIVEKRSGDRREFFMSRRRNEPAKGHLFVPGSCTLKDEPFSDAVKRTSKSSLGIELEIRDFQPLWVNEQFYPTNFKDGKFGTHYWVVALHHILKGISPESLRVDDSLGKYWLTRDKILGNPSVHDYAQEYFRPNPKNRIGIDHLSRNPLSV